MKDGKTATKLEQLAEGTAFPLFQHRAVQTHLALTRCTPPRLDMF